MRNPDQKMRFTNEELSLMKGLFAGNDELLYIVRKVMLQFNLTEQEIAVLNGVMNEPTKALLYKVFMPYLDPESPLFQMTDLVLGLGADIKPLNPDNAWPFIKAKELEIEYISQQLAILSGEGTIKIELNELGRLDLPKTQREQAYINVTARNFILSFIDSNIQQIKFLAGLKEETVEETIARLAQNSNK